MRGDGMAWTAPKTWTSNTTLTAAELNEQLRGNMNELLPHIAKETGEWFSVVSANKMVGRVWTSTTVGRVEGTTSTSYTDLATSGPVVELTTGPGAFVFVRCAMENSSADQSAIMSFQVTGATTDTGSSNMDARSMTMDGAAASNHWRFGVLSYINLTPGLNTFTAKYRCGGSGRSTYSARFLAVLAI